MKDVEEGGFDGGSFTLDARRPNAHGGALSKPNSSKCQPISNRAQKFTNHIHASPLEDAWKDVNPCELSYEVYMNNEHVSEDVEHALANLKPARLVGNGERTGTILLHCLIKVNAMKKLNQRLHATKLH